MNRRGFAAVAIALIVAIVLIFAGGVWYYQIHKTNIKVIKTVSDQSSGSASGCTTTAVMPTVSPNDKSPSVITKIIDNSDLVTISGIAQPVIDGITDQGPVPGNVKLCYVTISLASPLSISDFKKIGEWLQSYGLIVITDSGLDADGYAYLTVSGTTLELENAFQIELDHFYDPQAQQQFIGIKGTGKIPAALMNAVRGPAFPPPAVPQ